MHFSIREYESFYAMLQTADANEGVKGKILKVTNKNKIVKLLVGKHSIESRLFNKCFKVEIEKLKELFNNGAAPFDIVFDPSSYWVQEFCKVMEIKLSEIKHFLSMIGYICSVDKAILGSKSINANFKQQVDDFKSLHFAKFKTLDIQKVFTITFLMSQHFSSIFEHAENKYSYIVSLDDLKIPMDRSLTITEKELLVKRFHAHITRMGISVDMLSSPATGITRGFSLERRVVGKQ